MEPILEFFRHLTDTSDWPPRWYCGRWTDFHGWLYILSDLTIWAAYMAIPLILLRFILVKQGVPLSRVFILFGAFILLCGLTHLIDASMFWWPAYRVNALIRFLTAVVSIGTVIALIRYFDEAVGLRTSQEYNRELTFRQQAMQELARSNQELEQFAYVASHDLQSPLRTIENYLTLLDAQYGSRIDPEARQLIDKSTGAVDRMRILINDLLSLSHVGSTTHFTDIDLTELVNEIISDQQQDIRQAGASIQVGALPTLKAHRTDLKQLFSNLITNAIKYRHPAVAPQVTISVITTGDCYQFSVQDNGIGIGPQHYDRVFQLFQRLHGRNEFPGTGIGLATCKKVVEIYGGRIWIDSTPGGGTTFFFTLPQHIRTLQHDAQPNSLYSVN